MSSHGAGQRIHEAWHNTARMEALNKLSLLESLFGIMEVSSVADALIRMFKRLLQSGVQR